MAYAFQWLRSLFFSIQIYVMMLVFSILFLPWALVSPNGAFAACRTWCLWVRWTASWMIGLKTVVLGTPPTDAVIVAGKHQSFLDIVMIYSSIPRGRFIMKSLLFYAPLLGQYAWRIGCVFVDRGKRGKAIKKMLADVESNKTEAGQLVIYPQGTRIAPGVDAPYKAGSGILYKSMAQDCVPVACNVGVFWPRHGVYRKPGVATIEFLPRIKAGLEVDVFMAQLEEVIETRSDELMAQVGFVK